MNTTRKLMIILALVAIVATSLACKLAQEAVQPTIPPTATPLLVSTESAAGLATQVVGAAATVSAGGSMTLEVTEQQLTTAALEAMQQQTDMPIQNLQILLRDGQLKVTGTETESGFNMPVEITMQITTDGNGHVKTKVVKADVGFFTLPQSMVDQMNSQVETMLLAQFNTTSDAIYFDSIVIADGKMTITAHKR